MNRQGPADIRRLLESYGLEPSKALGQHFLADPNIVDKIVRVADVSAGDRVLEVGAGTGTLTQALVESGASVVAIEFDRGLAQVLRDLFENSIEVIEADVMKVDLDDVLGTEQWTLVANLPYNVGTALLLDVLRKHPQVTRLVVMIQREVADRLCALPGSRIYGIPSVIAGLYAETSIAFGVPPQVFIPPPDVQSAVVDIRRRTDVSEAAGRAVQLAETAFQQRRKMLRRSLAGVLSDPTATLTAAGIDPTARAEQLSPDDFIRLAEIVPT